MSKTKQPIWKLIANLGDANPVEHGGLFVFEDATGVYAPEIERIEPPGAEFEDYSEDNNWKPSARWDVRRVTCEPCTYIDGILSNNKFHPRHPVWFADELNRLTSSMDVSEERFIAMITTGTVVERAEAWRMVGDCFGWENLDHYPLSMDYESIKARVLAHKATAA